MSKGKWKQKPVPEEVNNTPVEPFADLIAARRGPRDKYRDMRREKRRAVLEEMTR